MRRLFYRLTLTLLVLWTLATAGVMFWSAATLPQEAAALGFDAGTAWDAVAANAALNLGIWLLVAAPLAVLALMLRPRRTLTERHEPRF